MPLKMCLRDKKFVETIKILSKAQEDLSNYISYDVLFFQYWFFFFKKLFIKENSRISPCGPVTTKTRWAQWGWADSTLGR